MAVSPGTGAGIGIALALLILFIAGPGTYYYRKRHRQQLEARKFESRDVEVSQAGEDYFGGVKPQLDDTAVDPEAAWRISRSTVEDERMPAMETIPASRSAVLNLEPNHPTILRPGPKGPRIAEVDGSGERRIPELQGDGTTPIAAELRADKSPPTDSTLVHDLRAQLPEQTLSKAAFSPSDDSLQLPALPGPLLPPKQR